MLDIDRVGLCAPIKLPLIDAASGQVVAVVRLLQAKAESCQHQEHTLFSIDHHPDRRRIFGYSRVRAVGCGWQITSLAHTYMDTVRPGCKDLQDDAFPIPLTMGCRLTGWGSRENPIWVRGRRGVATWQTAWLPLTAE